MNRIVPIMLGVLFAALLVLAVWLFADLPCSMALGNKWSRPPACAPCGPRPLDPPVGGTFHFENLIMPPLTKTCPKMVLSDKGGRGWPLCERRFCKKNFGTGRDSAGGALASVLRKHSSEGRTPDAAERCIRHCAGVSPSKGDRDLPPRFRDRGS